MIDSKIDQGKVTKISQCEKGFPDQSFPRLRYLFFPQKVAKSEESKGYS